MGVSLQVFSNGDFEIGVSGIVSQYLVITLVDLGRCLVDARNVAFLWIELHTPFVIWHISLVVGEL